MKDATRLNILDHGDLPKIQEDAACLSDLLAVPVWDIPHTVE
jgi:hypothetical protein